MRNDDTQKLEALQALLARHFLRLGRMTQVVMVDGSEIETEKALLEQDVAQVLGFTPQMQHVG